MTANRGIVHVNDLPDAILSDIFSAVSDTRARNAMSLVCLKWHYLERSTRTSLALRANIQDLYLAPTCFRAVTHLDLSLLSPWGHPLLDNSPNSNLTAQLLCKAFPSVISLAVYVRNPSTLHLLAPHWPNLRHVKLVRWHPRISSPLGSDFLPLLHHCSSLSSLDLSTFYYWTEDFPQALQAHPLVSASLARINLLTPSLSQGFKSHELLAITTACPNLTQLLAACTFDHRCIDFVGFETLLALASNCPRLSLLHLADLSSARNSTGDHMAKLSHAMLECLITSLPLLEELVLDVCQDSGETRQALELFNPNCPQLKSLKLGHFHGISCGIDLHPDGFALCRGLESLSIKDSADLTDSCLVAISLGCLKLARFEVEGCKSITGAGMRKLAFNLQQTLVEVKISCCKHLDTKRSLWALEPVQSHIRVLHVDCAWKSIRPLQKATSSSQTGLKMKRKYSDDAELPERNRNWARLHHLSLWIGAGEVLTPLSSMGLQSCPALEEIGIKVEGDCRVQPRPSAQAFGLSSLARYPRLSRLHLDCGGATGYALTAPYGQMDLSLWERFYLYGIGDLNLRELNYWPPQDSDFNQRSLSLPAAGLLADCMSLRKLFIHGTANEHLMMFLLKLPNLRDVQLREDYHAAPDGDTATEMRAVSCRRFEDALKRRPIPD